MAYSRKMQKSEDGSEYDEPKLVVDSRYLDYNFNFTVEDEREMSSRIVAKIKHLLTELKVQLSPRSLASINGTTYDILAIVEKEGTEENARYLCKFAGFSELQWVDHENFIHPEILTDADELLKQSNHSLLIQIFSILEAKGRSQMDILESRSRFQILTLNDRIRSQQKELAQKDRQLEFLQSQVQQQSYTAYHSYHPHHSGSGDHQDVKMENWRRH